MLFGGFNKGVMLYDGLAYFRPSLTHLGHDKSFIYEPRGFKTAKENAVIIYENLRRTVEPTDDLYILGDTLVGADSDEYLSWLAEIPVRMHLLWGNHCTDRRKALLSTLPNVVETLGCGSMLKYGKWSFLLSHYPTITANYDDYSKPLKRRVWNLHGHTHSNNKFQYMDMGWQSYNVSVDAHNCCPVNIETIITDIRDYYH